MREYCRVLDSPNLWEICILLETVPPSLLCLCLARTSTSPCSWGWVVIVCHANISMWAWIIYFLTYHSCPTKQDAQLVHTGTALMVASSVVCVVAAVTNDRYFPEARMSQKEAKAFFDHLKSTRPRQTIILKNKRVGVDIPLDTWTDYTRFPDLHEVNEVGGDMEVKLTLMTETENSRTEDFVNSTIERVILEHGESDSQNYKLVTSIPGRKIRVGPRHWTVFPAIHTNRKHRIYIYNHAHRPLLMDFFLRTAWIMNILACSGPVLAVFMSLRQRSVSCYVMKRSSINEPSYSYQNELPPSYSSLDVGICSPPPPSYLEATTCLGAPTSLPPTCLGAPTSLPPTSSCSMVQEEGEGEVLDGAEMGIELTASSSTSQQIRPKESQNFS